MGITAGLALRCTSDTLVSLLRLRDDQETRPPLTEASTDEVLGITRDPVEGLEGFEMEDSSALDDWQWLDTFRRINTQNTRPNMRAKRKKHALLAQAIPEASPSSSGA